MGLIGMMMWYDGYDDGYDGHDDGFGGYDGYDGAMNDGYDGGMIGLHHHTLHTRYL